MFRNTSSRGAPALTISAAGWHSFSGTPPACSGTPDVRPVLAIPVFLISLKAGGVGLNLTGTNTVITTSIPGGIPQWKAQQRTGRIGDWDRPKVVTSYKTHHARHGRGKNPDAAKSQARGHPVNHRRRRAICRVAELGGNSGIAGLTIFPPPQKQGRQLRRVFSSCRAL